MKFYWGVWGGKRNKWLDFGSDTDHHADCPIRNQAITQWIMSSFDEIFRIALQWYKGPLIKLLGYLDHHADSPNQESTQYGDNELPWWSFALTVCSCLSFD